MITLTLLLSAFSQATDCVNPYACSVVTITSERTHIAVESLAIAALAAFIVVGAVAMSRSGRQEPEIQRRFLDFTEVDEREPRPQSDQDTSHPLTSTDVAPSPGDTDQE